MGSLQLFLDLGVLKKSKNSMVKWREMTAVSTFKVSSYNHSLLDSDPDHTLNITGVVMNLVSPFPPLMSSSVESPLFVEPQFSMVSELGNRFPHSLPTRIASLTLVCCFSTLDVTGNSGLTNQKMSAEARHARGAKEEKWGAPVIIKNIIKAVLDQTKG